jgi:hypothetical protein
MSTTLVGVDPSPFSRTSTLCHRFAPARVRRRKARLSCLRRGAFIIPKEGIGMIRLSHASTLRRVACATALLSLAACGGEGSKYAGTWKRDLYGEGEVGMKMASNGGVELMLPAPRWPDSVDMKGRADFKGDTLIFKADSAGSPCQTADARYLINRTEDELHSAGVGMDTCGGRHAALVGVWKKA